MNEQIIELITSRGESMVKDLKIPGSDSRSVASALRQMVKLGALNRRLVQTPRRAMWAYSLINPEGPYLRGEPDYAYYLRTLGKRDECQSC
jgi:hypothetical protein